jgi:hypothetical protein
MFKWLFNKPKFNIGDELTHHDAESWEVSVLAVVKNVGKKYYLLTIPVYSVPTDVTISFKKAHKYYKVLNKKPKLEIVK